MNRLPKLPKNSLEKAMEKIAPQLKKKMAEADEMVKDIGGRLMRDQAEWLDKQMADLLPPNLYQAGLRGECESLIKAYMEKHRIRIVFVPDRLLIQILIGDRIHSRFVPNLTVDGEEVTWEQIGGVKGFSPDQN